MLSSTRDVIAAPVSSGTGRINAVDFISPARVVGDLAQQAESASIYYRLAAGAGLQTSACTFPDSDALTAAPCLCIKRMAAQPCFDRAVRACRSLSIIQPIPQHRTVYFPSPSFLQREKWRPVCWVSSRAAATAPRRPASCHIPTGPSAPPARACQDFLSGKPAPSCKSPPAKCFCAVDAPHPIRTARAETRLFVIAGAVPA